MVKNNPASMKAQGLVTMAMAQLRRQFPAETQVSAYKALLDGLCAQMLLNGHSASDIESTVSASVKRWGNHPMIAGR